MSTQFQSQLLPLLADIHVENFLIDWNTVLKWHCFLSIILLLTVVDIIVESYLSRACLPILVTLF